MTSLNLDGFITKKVNNFSYMFYYCSSLKSLDLTSFSNEHCDQCSGIFEGCYNMTLYINPNNCENFVNNIPEYVNPVFVYPLY